MRSWRGIGKWKLKTINKSIHLTFLFSLGLSFPSSFNHSCSVQFLKLGTNHTGKRLVCLVRPFFSMKFLDGCKAAIFGINSTLLDTWQGLTAWCHKLVSNGRYSYVVVRSDRVALYDIMPVSAVWQGKVSRASIFIKADVGAIITEDGAWINIMWCLCVWYFAWLTFQQARKWRG